MANRSEYFARNGVLRNYRDAQALLVKNGFEIRKDDSSAIFKRTYVGDVMVVSIAKIYGNNWIFRYHRGWFKENVS